MERERRAIMAQLWGGRFTRETDKLVYNFNASIGFDKKFYKQDIYIPIYFNQNRFFCKKHNFTILS